MDLYPTYSCAQEAILFCYPEKGVTAMTEVSAELKLRFTGRVNPSESWY
jgi:hypothetical protein